MSYDEKVAFEEANPDIVAQQQAVRDETLDEYISRFVAHCRENGYYITENNTGDFLYHTELMGVKDKSITSMFRGFQVYADHTGYKGAYPKETFSKVKHALERGLTFASETFFEPGGEPYLAADKSLGMYKRNTWKPFQHSGKKTADGKAPNLDIFFERTIHFCGAKHMDHWLDMVAFMMQYPGCRLPQFFYLVGGQGAGKGTYLTWYIMPLFAAGQATKTKDLPTGRFDTAPYAKKEFVYFDDPITAESDRQTLKSILTETYLEVEPKYGQKQDARLYFNTVLVCNPDRLFPVQEEDRRPYVAICPDDGFDWPTYREDIELPELIRCGEDPDDPRQHGAYIDALHDYFMTRPVDFNKMMRPIKTDDHLVVANMVCPVETAILDAAELFSVVGCSKLQEVIDYDKNKLPTHNTIGAVLKKHGWVEVRVRFNDREKPRAYYNPARFSDKPTQEQLRRAYNLEYYELGGVADRTTAPVVRATALELTEPPEELQAAFANDEPDIDNHKESYMLYIPDDYMSEDFRKRLTPLKNETQGFWMYVNGVKVWYDPATGSGEKPVEIIPDDECPEWAKAPCPDLPDAQVLPANAVATTHGNGGNLFHCTSIA